MHKFQCFTSTGDSVGRRAAPPAVAAAEAQPGEELEEVLVPRTLRSVGPAMGVEGGMGIILHELRELIVNYKAGKFAQVNPEILFPVEFLRQKNFWDHMSS